MITLLHAYGQTTFERESVKAYGSLENLIASGTLAGIPNREKSLTQLWEAANRVFDDEPEQEPAQESPEETTEKEE